MSEGNGVTIMEEGISKELAAVLKPAPVSPKFFQIVPKNIQDLKTFADMAAASDLVPKDYKGKAGNCFIAIQFGAELGIPPLQSLQNIAVINGKPGVYGDVGKALLLGKGFGIEERDIKDIEKTNEAWCKITRPRHMNPTNQPPTERTFSKANAQTAGVWGVNVHKTHPYRMLAWRAFWFAARDAAADVLKGICGIEELESYKTDAVETTAVDAPRELVEKEATIDGKKTIVEIKTGEPTPENPIVDAAAPVEPTPPANGLNVDQRKHIVELMKQNGVTPEILGAHLKTKYGITATKPTKFVTQDKYAELCGWIESPQDELGI
jgi:hypothetical protein